MMTISRRYVFWSQKLALLLLLFSLLECTFAADPKGTNLWQNDLLAWRAQQAKDLRAPDGWLTLIGLNWLKPGSNRFGAAEDNTIRLPAQTAAHWGDVRWNDASLQLVAPTAGFPGGLQVDGHAPVSPQKLLSDEAGKPSKITLGTVLITVIHRGDRNGLRIKDSQAATRAGFHGLKWYAPNPAFRVQAKWIPYNPPKQMKVPTVLGTEVESTVPGAAEFVIDGNTVRLEPIVGSMQDKELFFIVRDTTSKSETYGAGRFLYTELPNHGLTQPGELSMDFNRLENPPCAYTPYATCPVAPAQNRLQVALPAGEQRYHD